MAPKSTHKYSISAVTLLLVFLLTFIPQQNTAAAVTLPKPQSPSGTITATSPTFVWTKGSTATMYNYQLMQGSNLLFASNVPPSYCKSTTCSIKVELTLTPGKYQWSVKSQIGTWRSYSSWMKFTVASQPAAAIAPTAIPTLPAPTASPTAVPTLPAPTASPTAAPTLPAPTASPTAVPTLPAPTASPTAVPTLPAPTASPTAVPTLPTPTASPTAVPTLPTPTASPTAAPTTAPASGIHAIGLTYPDYSTSRATVPQIEQQLKTSGMNMVALNAGRVEWTFFKWAGHQSQWAGAVQDTNIDFLAQDAARFGQWAHVDAMIDVFAPAYITAHPTKAAINALGAASPNLVSTVEMVNGEFSVMLLSMVEYIAANYPVNSISLTELQYRVDGYGPDDKASYLAYSGRTDWPRQSNGQPAIDDPSIGNWRSYMIGTLLSKASAIAHKYGKQLFMDVTLNPDNLALKANNKGQNYNVMLANCDKIVVWGYFGEDQYPPTTFVTVGQFLTNLGKDRVILSIGLWGANGGTVTASDVKTAVVSSQQGGMPNVWITPYSMTTTDIWGDLTQLWGV